MSGTDRLLKARQPHERRLRRALKKFFDNQASRIVSGLRDHRSITTATVADVFKPADENTLLLAAVSDPIVIAMAAGAAGVLAESKKRQRGKKDFDASLFEDFDLPEHVQQAITTAFGELEQQPYWLEIQSTTGDHLTDLIDRLLQDGKNSKQIAKEVNASLGGLAKWRSYAIARTETTGSLNAGNHATLESLAADGLIAGRTWRAILDGDTRETHSALDGTTVGMDEDFDVGGHSAPYPGHWSLPAEERVRCRCTTTAEFEA